MIGTSAYARVRMRSVLVALLSVAVALGLLVAPASARADAAGVTGVRTLDSGAVAVLLSDSSALSVRISVRASTDPAAPVVATTDDLTYDPAVSGWVTTSPVALPGGSGYGDYPVDVDYRLQSGPTQHWAAADHAAVSTFGYRRHAGVVGAAFDRTVTDYDHRTVTLSGSVHIFDPATGSTTAAPAGTRVGVAWTNERQGFHAQDRTATAVTDASGAFRIDLTADGAIHSASVRVLDPSADTSADVAAQLPDVEAVTLQTRIAAGPMHARVHAGQTFVVSGTVQRLTNSGWKPLVGASVVTAVSSIPDSYTHRIDGQLGSGTSGSTGRFSYRARATRTTAIYTFPQPNAYLPESAYYYDNAATGSIEVPRPALFTAQRFVLDEFQRLTATGALRGSSCGSQKITLEYSRTGRSGWSAIGTTRTTDYGSRCPFTVSTTGAVDGYYRLVHAESDELLAATSVRSARLHRTPTRVTSFAVSPTRPSVNGSLHATGQFTQRSGSSWVALRHVLIVLVVRPKGESQFYRAATGTTDGTGHFSLRSKVYGDGSWGVYYEADAGHLYTQSGLIYVDAR